MRGEPKKCVKFFRDKPMLRRIAYLYAENAVLHYKIRKQLLLLPTEKRKNRKHVPYESV